MPAAITFSRSPTIAFAVIAMAGSAAKRGWARSARVVSKPSITGIRQSISPSVHQSNSTRSKACRSSINSASSASNICRTSISHALRNLSDQDPQFKVKRERGVVGQQVQGFGQCLGHQHAVEGVAMVGGKRAVGGVKGLARARPAAGG